MTQKDELFKTRLRTKGQITLPVEVRDLLSLNEGDDLIFRLTEGGRIIVERAITIPAEQAWFWSERWQRMEHAAQADIDAGRVDRYASIEEAVSALEQLEDAQD